MGNSREETVVLVIDDEYTIREVVGGALEKAGYTVIKAKNGGEGLRLLRGMHVDVLITDVIMPEKEGLEIIKSLRSTNSDILIIAMSGAADSDLYLRMAKELGAVVCLQKPFRAHVIVNAVGKVLGK